MTFKTKIVSSLIAAVLFCTWAVAYNEQKSETKGTERIVPNNDEFTTQNITYKN